ncbi:hypothetical protein [Capnocytophaga leadbetteri]|uniref:hypothetical protein n=1 Tax=Capnocytophaga leadbetteri TaxID=327575 RepID=UPI0028EC03EE|nr:hypothetical protein [Capnocytophaga leadbetteri]
MIYYAILCIGVAVLLYMIIRQGIANFKREKAIEELREKWQNALVDERQTREVIMNLVKNTYGENTVSAIEKGLYSEGMPNYLVKMAVGIPREVQSAVFQGATTERWHYKTLTLTFQNGRLIGWESVVNSTPKAGI